MVNTQVFCTSFSPGYDTNDNDFGITHYIRSIRKMVDNCDVKTVFIKFFKGALFINISKT